MNIRKITNSEYKRTCEIFALSFEFTQDSDLNPEDFLQETLAHPKNRNDIYYNHRWAAIDDDGTTIMGFLKAIPAPIYFDHQVVTTSCIGDVCSLPQFRKRGVIRACFKKSFQDTYDEGYLFSYLYPFSTKFYRQFGYERCCESTVWTLDIRNLPYFDTAQGTVYLNENGSCLNDIKKIYNVFAQDYNLMFQREDCDWLAVKKNNPVKDKEYIYVYHDIHGTPISTLSFTKNKVHDKTIMDVHALYFTCLEGLKGLINHMRSYASHYDTVRLTLPKDLCFEALLPETSLYSVQRTCDFNGMVRVLNVLEVLKCAKYIGSGEITLTIHDNDLDANNRTFHLSFTEGKATRVDVVDTKSDIELNIGDFSKLICGAFHPDHLPYMDTVIIHNETPTLHQVFYPKKNFIRDYF